MSYKKHEQILIREHLGSPPVFGVLLIFLVVLFFFGQPVHDDDPATKFWA
jgi:hypothetical protein